MAERMGVIAGSGRLPALVIAQARRDSIPLTVAAIREEADPGLEEQVNELPRGRLQWIGVGQLGKLIKLFKKDDVRRAVMVGQVRHVTIFAPGSTSPLKQLARLPDLRMVRLLSSLKKRNTASLIEAVIEELEAEGVQLVDSTVLLQEALAPAGVLTNRPPDERELGDMDFGRPLARELARLDIGQTIVVKDRAVVAVEAMEGTDAAIARAAEVAGAGRLTVIKSGRPSGELRFDVPVVGPTTIEVMAAASATALAVEADRCIFVDRPELLSLADRHKISIVGESGP